MLASRNKHTLFTKDTKGFTEFKKLSDLKLGTSYKVYGFFMNTKSRYGDYYIAISEGFYINLPKSMNDTMRGIIDDCRTDAKLLESINAGNESITIKEIESDKYGKIRVVDFN